MSNISPKSQVYHASKGYVSQFSEGIHLALEDHNVHLSCMSPGTTATEFYSVSDNPVNISKLTPAQTVVDRALDGLYKNKPLTFGDRQTHFFYHCLRHMPRKWIPFFYKKGMSHYMSDPSQWDAM